MIHTIVLATALITGAAEPSNISGGSVVSQSQSLPQDISDGWLAYQTLALPDLGTQCCWQSWHDTDRGRAGCTLEKGESDWNMRGESEYLPNSDHIQVFALQAHGKTTRLLTVGNHCPMNLGKVSLTWLGELSNDSSAQWLSDRVESASRTVQSGALYALSTHAEGDIESKLTRYARSADRRLANDSVFLLGQARRKPGFKALEALLEELPNGSTRRQINFALGENNSPEAQSLLISIADHDDNDKQRGDALFWLAQSYPVGAVPALVKALNSDNPRALWESALHGLSEVQSDAAATALEHAASNHRQAKVRGQAMFWLAQGYPAAAAPFLMAFLGDQKNNPVFDGLAESAVFAISQLPEPGAADSLLKLARSDSYGRSVRRKALFWLAQSEDPQAADALVALLRQ